MYFYLIEKQNIMKDNKIHWEFVEWAEKACYEAFIEGVNDNGVEYEAIGIMGAGEIVEIKDIEKV